MSKKKPPVDYTGRRFGKLLCLRKSENGFLYRCDCGNTLEIEGYKIHYRKSCGCLYSEAAKKRGNLFKIPRNNCIYCGDECKDKTCPFCKRASKDLRKIECLYKSLCLHGTSTITIKKKLR